MGSAGLERDSWNAYLGEGRVRSKKVPLREGMAVDNQAHQMIEGSTGPGSRLEDECTEFKFDP